MNRDGRTTNHMDAFTLTAHLRLTQWGEWARNDRSGPQDVQSISGPIADQRVAAGSKGAPPVHMPTDIAITDRAVASLGEIDTKVILAYYTRWEANEAIAKRLRMRAREFENVLRRARWRTGAYIAGFEAARENNLNTDSDTATFGKVA